MNAVVERKEAQLDQATSLLQVIERAARDPSIDIDKMERLFALQERVVQRGAESEFNRALSECQAEMRLVSADATNPQTRSKYASYGQLDKHLRPIYTKHGFALSFSDGDTDKQEHVRVVCVIRHSGGHKETHHKDMPADGKGAKGGDVMTKTHAAGAAQQYGMRYLLKGIFNVAIGEDDRDGNDEPTITETQLMDLKALAEEVGAQREPFLKYFGITELSQLPAAKYKDAIAALEKKRRKQK